MTDNVLATKHTRTSETYIQTLRHHQHFIATQQQQQQDECSSTTEKF